MEPIKYKLCREVFGNHKALKVDFMLTYNKQYHFHVKCIVCDRHWLATRDEIDKLMRGESGYTDYLFPQQ